MLQPKLQQPRRLFDPAEEVSCTGLFRIHWHPKRSPQAHAVVWRDRIITDTDDFVVVSKPWGVQVTHRVDNVLESLVACVGRVRQWTHVIAVPPHTSRLHGPAIASLCMTNRFLRYFFAMHVVGRHQYEVPSALELLPLPWRVSWRVSCRDAHAR